VLCTDRQESLVSGAVVGSYTDSSGVGHGYLRYHGTFTTIDFPGAIFKFTGAGNPKGDIVGLYTDSGGVNHAFLLSNGVFTSFDFPGAFSLMQPGSILAVSSLLSILTRRALSTDLSGRRK
jgi:hypothetical protein